ncbi:hypothetical protein [Thalassoglobus polymorphus]|uniref:Uncharacterized protein n=1 Tax=Thalassoglobus polymorphus TaxID=2527994 RepID=A0A517QTM7_9PLAN|nr:hypothetical protein [Thalassoglobus polymorphus]QDT34996.1 hypothetical protein Mal48_42690 [Thalassoglobus polymorphus]
MKNAALLVLAMVFLITLIGVLIHDQQPVAGSEAPDLTSSINPDHEESNGDQSPGGSSQSSSDHEIAWSTKSGEMQRSPNSIPKPYEPGVVHLGPGASLGGKLPFPKDSPWNQRIDTAPVDPLSRTLISSIGITKNLFPAFGSGTWEGAPIGIPYVVISSSQPSVPIVYTAYGDESDPGPYPIPADAQIEGHPNEDGDRHVIVIDRDNWKLYELFRAFSIGDGQLWRAESGAIFDLAQHPSRPVGWTSADAAGLPIFPGLVRYDEVMEQKEIRHALRFTVNDTRRAFVPPATHWASRSNDPRLPPMGMRVRLRANYDISDFPPEAQVILKALKKYGMILADNGGDWYISGAPDPRWDNDALHTLKKVQGKDLEVVLIENLVAE